MRTELRARPTSEHKDRLAQLELSLDGYGGAQSERASRVRALLPQVDSGAEDHARSFSTRPHAYVTGANGSGRSVALFRERG
jgi:hypothetical protein